MADFDDAELPLVAVQVGHDFKFWPFDPLLADGDDRQAKVPAGVSPARERMNQPGGRIGGRGRGGVNYVNGDAAGIAVYSQRHLMTAGRTNRNTPLQRISTRRPAPPANAVVGHVARAVWRVQHRIYHHIPPCCPHRRDKGVRITGGGGGVGNIERRNGEGSVMTGNTRPRAQAGFGRCRLIGSLPGHHLLDATVAKSSLHL
jgi:hypothetical protein